MAIKPKKVTIAVKVLREELPTIHKVARRLGYKNLHQWLETMFRREYTKALSEIVGSQPNNTPGEQPL